MPLRFAVEKHNVDVVKLLLADSQVHPFDDVFIIACEKGTLEIVNLLSADKRVNPGASNNKPLRNALCNGHIHVAKLLLWLSESDSRINPADEQNEHLIIACQNGYIEIVAT